MNEYKPEGQLIKTVRNYEYISSRSGLEKALEKQMILEAPVILCDHNFNLHVELCPGVKGLMPRDEVEYSPDGEQIKDIAILTRVGKTVCFKVSGFTVSQSGEITAILSRRAAQRECVENYLMSLCPGDIIPAKVTHLESFGAFVDIGCGRISLLSIDCISVSRISHPSARLSVGELIFTAVKSIDDRGRIFEYDRGCRVYPGTYRRQYGYLCRLDTGWGPRSCNCDSRSYPSRVYYNAPYRLTHPQSTQI